LPETLPQDDDLGPDNARVFLSYSRKDRERAQSIADVLRERHFGVYKDTDDILPTEEWKGRLEQLIAEADTIVFLLSPNSVASEVCAWEVEYASDLNKRIAPIVIDDVEAAEIPPLLARLNFIFATERDRFQDAVDSLVSALNSDIDWIREHTRLAGLARRWRDNARSGRLLLRGQDIADAEQWRDSRPKEAPEVLSLHADFIAASRAASARRQRLVAAFSLAGLAVAIGLAAFAFVQREAAVENERIALENEQTALRNERLAEAARGEAEAARDEALAQRNRAQISQSRMLTRLSVEQREAGKPVEAALLALEALPDRYSADPGARDRPLVDDALVALKQASRNITELAILHAGKGEHGIVLSPDGRMLAVHGQDTGELALIDMTSRQQIRRIVGKEIRSTSSPRFMPDGEHLMLPGSDGSIWYLETRAEGRLFNQRISDSGILSAFPLLGEQKVAALTASGDLHVARPGKAPYMRIGSVSAAAASPDGSRLAMLDNGAVSILDLAGNGGLVGPGPVLEGPLKKADQLLFSPDGRWLAAWSEHLVWLLDGVTGEYLVKTGAREQSIMRVSFGPDSSLMTVSGADGASPVYDLAGRKLVARLQGEAGWLFQTVLLRGNSAAVSAAANGDLLLWDIAGNQVSSTLKGHTNAALRVIVTPDERHAITSGQDGTVRLWQLPAREAGGPSIVEEFAGNPVLSRDGTLVALSEAGIFEIRSGRRLDVPAGGDPWLKLIAFFDDGRLLALSGRGEHDNACLLSPPDYRPEGCLLGEPQQNIWNADADPAGRTAVVHRVRDGATFISAFDLASGDRIGELPACPKDGERGCYSDPKVSPDGGRILLTRLGVNVHVFDRNLTSAEVKIEPDYRVSSIHPVPGQDRVVIWGTADNTARLHDTTDGRLLQSFSLDLGRTDDLTFSSDGRYMATVKYSGELEVHDLKNAGRLVFGARASSPEGMSGPVFNRDGSLLLVGDGPRLTAFDVTTGKRLDAIALDFGETYPNIFAKGFSDDDRTITGWTWDGPQSFALFRDPAEAITAAKGAAARCLTPEQRARNFLGAEPPRWCITGAGLELEPDPANWKPLWPYQGDAWRTWLMARDAGETPPLPGSIN